jgi:hypothetical protein
MSNTQRYANCDQPVGNSFCNLRTGHRGSCMIAFTPDSAFQRQIDRDVKAGIVGQKQVQFTPGPWTIEKRGHADDIYRQGYGIVCEMPDQPDVEAKANARLIAAAPDGYELAKMVLEHWYPGLPDSICDKASEIVTAVEVT